MKVRSDASRGHHDATTPDMTTTMMTTQGGWAAWRQPGFPPSKASTAVACSRALWPVLHLWHLALGVSGLFDCKVVGLQGLTLQVMEKWGLHGGARLRQSPGQVRATRNL